MKEYWNHMSHSLYALPVSPYLQSRFYVAMVIMHILYTQPYCAYIVHPCWKTTGNSNVKNHQRCMPSQNKESGDFSAVFDHKLQKPPLFNTLASWKCGCNFKNIIFIHSLDIDIYKSCNCEAIWFHHCYHTCTLNILVCRVNISNANNINFSLTNGCSEKQLCFFKHKISHSMLDWNHFNQVSRILIHISQGRPLSQEIIIAGTSS